MSVVFLDLFELFGGFETHKRVLFFAVPTLKHSRGHIQRTTLELFLRMFRRPIHIVIRSIQPLPTKLYPFILLNSNPKIHRLLLLLLCILFLNFFHYQIAVLLTRDEGQAA